MLDRHRYVRHRVTTWSVVALVVLAMGCSDGSPTSPSSSRTSAASAETQALSISCPGSLTTSTPNDLTPVPATFTAPKATGGVPPLQVSCTRESGSLFPAGTTTVQCTAIDAVGQTSSCLFLVTVTAPPPRLTRTRFLAFGDSITAGEISAFAASTQGPPNFSLVVVPSASYPAQLGNMLKAHYRDQAGAITVLNSGVSGELASQALARLRSVLTDVRPEVVLLLEGYNDLGAYGDAGVGRATQGLEALAREARLRGAQVVLATVPPPRPGGKNAHPPERVTALNAAIRDTARSEGAPLVDIHTGLATDLTRYIGTDGLHPNEAGYQKMAELFMNVIRENFQVQ